MVMWKRKNKNEKDIIKIAREVLNNEVRDFKRLEKQLKDKRFNEKFLQFLSALEKCKGRVLVSGVGKSGIIGEKISSIFSSIGVSSFFIHPVEAVHGDLGCIQKDDVLLAISCSGETSELKNIVEFCNKNKVDVLSITCKKDSWLEKNSKINIFLNMKNEAINDFPIPTTSSILTLAICDAITACLVKNEGLTYEKYAKIHCGGKIGEIMREKSKKNKKLIK